VRAQLIEHRVVVGVAGRQVEYQFGPDSQPRHARVVNGAAKQIAAWRPGQGGARLIQHPRKPRVALELSVTSARRVGGQILGRRQAVHR
jgi:hypothetical protein